MWDSTFNNWKIAGKTNVETPNAWFLELKGKLKLDIPTSFTVKIIVFL